MGGEHLFAGPIWCSALPSSLEICKYCRMLALVLRSFVHDCVALTETWQGSGPKALGVPLSHTTAISPASKMTSAGPFCWLRDGAGDSGAVPGAVADSPSTPDLPVALP